MLFYPPLLGLPYPDISPFAQACMTKIGGSSREARPNADCRRGEVPKEAGRSHHAMTIHRGHIVALWQT